MRRIIWLLLFPLFPAACKKERLVERALYYWRAQSLPGDTVAAPVPVNHCYLRLFDVDWNDSYGMPAPMAEFQSRSGRLPPRDAPGLTPVVYITARTFEHLDEKGCELLATRVARRVEGQMKLLASQHISQAVRAWSRNVQAFGLDGAVNLRTWDTVLARRIRAWDEVQIDCDWTTSTRDRYFYFLKSVKQRLPDKVLSATIRLYPYKYPKKMGVPPADRGMLMAYNLGNIQSAATENSVFTLAEMEKYLDAKEYPLPLDAALPVFGWYVLFRGPQYKGIVHNLDGLALSDSTLFRKEPGGRYRLLREIIVGEQFLRAGDVLRSEWPAPAEVEKAAGLLQEKLPDLRRMAFYHWTPENLHRYESVLRAVPRR